MVRLARFVVWDEGRGYVAGWWPGAAGRCGVARRACVAQVRVGLSARWVKWVSAGLPSLGACVLVPCPVGVLAPRGVLGSVGWGVVASSGALDPLPSSPSVILPSPVLGAVAMSPSSSGASAVARVVALAVAGVIAWQLGCAGGLRGVLGGSPGGCSPFLPCGCTFLPLCGVRWPVGATRCSPCGVRSVLRRRVLAGVRLRGSCGVDWGWGGAALSVVACPSCVCALVPVVAHSSLVPRPLEMNQQDSADPAISSRRNRDLLREESGPRVSHKALWGPAGKKGFFPQN